MTSNGTESALQSCIDNVRHAHTRVEALSTTSPIDPDRLADAMRDLRSVVDGALCTDDGWKPNAVTLEGTMARPVEYLWRDRIPLGMVTILCGAKASGKGQMFINIAAAVTNGGRLPDRCDRDGLMLWENVPQGTVLYLNAEDPREQTIVPRLIEAGADLSKVVHVATLDRGAGKNRDRKLITLAEDMRAIEDMLDRYRPILFGIDTLFSHAGCDVSSNTEMGPVMARLSLLAERYNCAIVVIHHPVKVAHGRASSDVSGATAIGTASRSVLMSGADEDKSRRALFHLDSNVGPEAPGLAYEVGPFRWTGAATVTLDEIRRHAPSARGGARAEDRAVEWLEDRLSAGPQKTRGINDDAKRERISLRAIGDARRTLKVEDGRMGATGWLWLPGDEPEWSRQKRDPGTT